MLERLDRPAEHAAKNIATYFCHPFGKVMGEFEDGAGDIPMGSNVCQLVRGVAGEKGMPPGFCGRAVGAPEVARAETAAQGGVCAVRGKVVGVLLGAVASAPG